MGKFAGFLKRVKNFVKKGVNTVAKGFKVAKNIWNNVITKPGVSILNTLIPGTKPLTDALWTVDDQFNKGLDWVIDKTSSTNNNKLPAHFVKDTVSSFRDKMSNVRSNMFPLHGQPQQIALPTVNRNLNFNR